MSVAVNCMKSAKSLPRFLVLGSKRTRITAPSQPFRSKRWNSSNSKPFTSRRGNEKQEDEKKWNTTTVLSLMGVSSILAGTFTVYQTDGNGHGIGRRERTGERDYSNEEKFVEPRYASVKDLEAVSSFSFA